MYTSDTQKHNMHETHKKEYIHAHRQQSVAKYKWAGRWDSTYLKRGSREREQMRESREKERREGADEREQMRGSR